MAVLLETLNAAWAILADMAPYLLLGFLIAGALSVWVSTAFIETHLGRPGWLQVVKASLLGVPIPLCSCSVIPVTASLRRHGASRGATIAFLSSTPQTGIDSILVTHALLGPVFTGVRVLMAFVTGMVGGCVVDALPAEPAPDPAPDETPATPCCCGGTAPEPLASPAKSCCSQAPSPPKPEGGACCRSQASEAPGWQRALRYGFITLPGDIGGAILIGLLISGVLGAVIPPGFFAEHLPEGLLQLGVAMAIGIPLYVCSTASVPIAVGLLAAGMSPGAALVFLITGPATNAATFTTVSRLLGRRVTLVYLAVIAACALGAGLLLDALDPVLATPVSGHLHAEATSPLGHATAALLLLILVAAQRPRSGRG